VIKAGPKWSQTSLNVKQGSSRGKSDAMSETCPVSTDFEDGKAKSQPMWQPVEAGKSRKLIFSWSPRKKYSPATPRF
jgi:hypothetical protein